MYKISGILVASQDQELRLREEDLRGKDQDLVKTLVNQLCNTNKRLDEKLSENFLGIPVSLQETLKISLHFDRFYVLTKVAVHYLHG